MESGKSNGHYLAAVVGAMLIWSTSFVVTKLAYESFGPLTLGALRFAVATVLLAAVLAFRRGFILPPRRDLLLLSASGVLGITLYFAMENIGVSFTSAANAALIMSSYPAITVLMERLVYGIRVSRRKWLGILLAMVGVTFISAMGHGGGGDRPLAGNLILSATGIVWALYNFTTRAVVNRYSALTVSFYQTLAGTIVFIPIALIEASSWRTPTAFSVGMLLYLGVLCSVVAFMLYNYGLRKLSAGTAVSLANLVPVFGVLFGVLILREGVNAWQLAGGLVVIGGVYQSARE